MSKYSEFFRRYSESGMTQKLFAEQEGISPSMVSYYINRAKREGHQSTSFSSIELIGSRSTNDCIEITTSKGMNIKIPI